MELTQHRLMRLSRARGIRARHTRRYKVTADSSHHLSVANNFLKRHFRPDASNRISITGLTYIRTDEGSLYMALLFDLSNRELVCRACRHDGEHRHEALILAWFRRKTASGLLHRSD